VSRRVLLVLCGAVAFGLLATLNAAGYRYGVADQAFYVPAVQQHLDPALFPRDGTLIASQSRLLIFDELFAIAQRATGLSIPWLFLAGYLTTLGVLYAALVALGRTLYTRPWTVAALVFAATLRHRITKTGANTLEGHFHPRMLAFAIGIAALVAVLRRRAFIASLCVLAAGLLHPTTATWFAIWVGIALAVNEPRLRRPLALVAVTGVLAGVVILATSTLTLAAMDEPWIKAFEDKDYIFSTDWSASSWLLNLLYIVLIVLGFAARQRAGVARPSERGLVAGCLALVALFFLALPLVAFRSAFIVQLQISRVFWMADLLATVYVIWLIAEGWLRSPRGSAHASPLPGGESGSGWRAPALAIVLALLAVGRGWYVLRVEHPGRPLVEVDLPDDAWCDASRWIERHTPKDAHLLADPGHAWKYGSSLRVSAARDVFLEDVKDAAVGFYDRGIALRVAERRAAGSSMALGDASAAGPAADLPGHLRALASRYDLDYLVTEQSLPFPEAYQNARFHVYRLRP
jgi:hypothetical protein